MKTVLIILLSLMPAAILKAQTNTPDTSSAIYTVVDTSPSFPGGEAALGKFIQQNMKYPKIGNYDNISGRVSINFIVEKNGTLTNIKVAKAGWDKLDNEVMRVVKLSPKWLPGEQYGKKVRVSYTLYIPCILLSDN